jgi:hypothetical protein
LKSGIDRDAKVDFATVHVERNPTLLGNAGFVRDQARQDLDSGDDLSLHRLGDLDHLVKHAVDAKPNHGASVEGIEVDVAAAVVNPLGQNEIDHRAQLSVVPGDETGRLFGQVGNLEALHDRHGKENVGGQSPAERFLEAGEPIRGEGSDQKLFSRILDDQSGAGGATTLLDREGLHFIEGKETSSFERGGAEGDPDDR